MFRGRKLLVICAFGVPLFAAPTLRITSPAKETVFHPGDTIPITVDTSEATFTAVVIIPHSPLKWSDIVEAPPYRFSVYVPPDTTPGEYRLTADGVVKPGQIVHSESIDVDIERPDLPVRIHTEPFAPFELSIGERFVLNIVGTYRDGAEIDLNNSTQTKYISEAPNIVTISSDGLVTAVSTGSTELVIRVGEKSIKIKATVKKAKEHN
jgi:hypothetical protein